ncbi:alanine--tRNA ligase [Myxococcota bacterium]
MSKPTSSAIRQHFLAFFAKHDHAVVKSSSLIPANDPTLMFTNAGMVQFKDVFVGAEKRPYSRATSSQKCMRVSGKHNDLEEVGPSPRHHTFFEMLGNFSFGDYFKEEAIELAWRFVTAEVGLDPKRLWVTVFGGEGDLPPDNEARTLWKKITGVSDDRILGMDMKENFWAMGDTGPCGPCTEIHFDQGSGPEPTLADFESGRVVEIWNNVFMQFERKPDGNLVPLPKPSVDTGMGFERLAAVLQGETSNYHTDLFTPIIQTIAEAVGKPYTHTDNDDDVSMRVIADHARATAFLAADGLQPDNEGRAYVMRRIMRRAIRHGKRLGFDDLFFYRACDAVVMAMGEAYPELEDARSLIRKVAETEERRFRRVLDIGLRLLGGYVDRTRHEGRGVLSGDDMFKLKDTYGFPADLTEVIAHEHDLSVDWERFRELEEGQRTGSQDSKIGDEAVGKVYKDLAARLGRVGFVGYPHEDDPVDGREGIWRHREANGTLFLEVQSVVKALVQNGAPVERADTGEIDVILDPTPFYGEAGGQVGDRGIITTDDGLSLEVTDCKRPLEGLTVSRCRVLEGLVTAGQSVWAGYEPEMRKETRAHHSATHLLHASLRQVLGDHVKQQGSLVDPDHLRFDYAHFEAPSWENLKAIEDDANSRIQKHDTVKTASLAFDEAKQRGAIALFGEKYGDTVRMVSMGSSVELCGGTHVTSTGELDLLLITNEEAVASGVRRIEAEVSKAARLRARQTAAQLRRAAVMLTELDQPQADTDNTILQALVKAIRQGSQLQSELDTRRVEAVRIPTTGIDVPRLGETYSVAEARTVRDLWQGVVTMANARANEADTVAERFKHVDPGHLLDRYGLLLKANRDNEKRLEKARAARLTTAAGDLMHATREIAGVKVLATRVDDVDGKALRELADKLRDRLRSGILCIGGESNGKATLLVGVTRDLTDRFQAGRLIRDLAPIIGGRGGGKPELAQAGGSHPEALEEAFARLIELVEAR